MAATLTCTVSASINWTYSNALAGGITSTNQSGFTSSISLTNGTGAAGTANLLYAVQATIAASGNTTVTLDSGITDFFGNSITAVRVKVIYLSLASGGASSVLFGNGTNPFVNWITPSTGALRIRGGGFFVLACSDATAYAVTSSTADLVKVLNEDSVNAAVVQMAFVMSTA